MHFAEHCRSDTALIRWNKSSKLPQPRGMGSIRVGWGHTSNPKAEHNIGVGPARTEQENKAGKRC